MAVRNEAQRSALVKRVQVRNIQFGPQSHRLQLNTALPGADRCSMRTTELIPWWVRASACRHITL
jgi:hypothetical protein